MHDIFVVSDLHLGRGKNPRTARYYPLEAFFYDEDFEQFCRHLCEEARIHNRPFRLVVNGDAFDLLRIEPEDDGRASPALFARRYGPVLTPVLAARLMEQILVGHPRFVAALAMVLRSGFEVVFLPGNHDIEIQWETVQDVLRAHLRNRLLELGDDDPDVERSLERLGFRQWFYYEEGRVWIEHGCQYDTENSFQYPLRAGLVDAPDTLHEAEQDLPLGNFFQRYLYNAFGHITFIVPTARANVRYFKWLLVNQPRLLLRVMVSHAPFGFQVIRRIAQTLELSTKRRLSEHHGTELNRMAETSGLGDKLREIDALKAKKADVVSATREIGWQLAKFGGGALVVALCSAALWFSGFLAINQLQSGFGLKTLLFLVLNFIGLAGVVGVVVFALLRASPPEDASPLQTAAGRIGDILSVPVVSFGHTHEEVVAPLGRAYPTPSGWYFNTGTWIAIFTHDVLIPRERVQYTFLRIRGHEGELLRWSPERDKALPVVLLEDGR